MSALMNTYGRLPLQFSRGDGVWLTDDKGTRYLDGISGIGVNALGHAHPAVTKAIQSQAGELLHTSNLYGVAKQTELAEKLCAVSGMSKVFFSNSGAEANEAAIKLARLHGHNKGIANPNIVVMDAAFHGRTLATLTASGNRKIQAGFEPLVSGFVRAPFDDIDAIKAIAKQNKSVTAILVEPIQGEGGVNMPAKGYLAALRQICDEHDWLLMLDEVQTGNARTGKYFAYQHEGILPDVVLTAKGLGNGVPIGACLASGAAAELFQPGKHGSTFGGNPLVCAAALAVVDTINSDNLCEQVAAQGHKLLTGFEERIGKLGLVKSIRGQGLMIGIELREDCPELVQAAIEHGALINVTAGRVIRLLPPLIISNAEAEQLLDIVCKIIETKQESLSGAA